MAKQGRTSIGFEWSLVNSNEVKGYYIQRSNDNKTFNVIKKIDNRSTTHYVDENLNLNTSYFYRIASYDVKGTPSIATPLETKTLMPISPVSYLAVAHINEPKKIKIVFRPHHNERVNGYYIQRLNDSSEWKTITTVPSRLMAEYIDKNLEDGKIYKYRIIAKTYDNLTSEPSKVLAAKTLSKPTVVLNVIASNNLPKKIKISWDKTEGAAKYNIYRSDSQMGSYDLIHTTRNRSIEDIIKDDGVTKYYKIRSVNQYSLESVESENGVMGATLSTPTAPVISVEKTDKTVVITLSSPDGRAQHYTIKREDEKEILEQKKITAKKFVDVKIKKGKSYHYKVYAIDKNGLISEPKEAEITF